jgi:hypothetical protein
MKTTDLESQIDTISQARLDRRKFFRQAGYFGLGAAASGLALTSAPARAQSNPSQTKDTTAEILTAFLIAEGLASTFYYNGLVGAVVQDVNLAGPGGSAINVTSQGNAGNVDYLRAALYQEVEHAQLFRTLLFPGKYNQTTLDPYQTFYFPAGTFDTLKSFLGILDALENAFIGAYITLVQEFAVKAALSATGKLTGPDAAYSTQEYEFFAKAAASIMGVECEHRVLGRVIGNENPANNCTYEQLDGLQSIYNGPHSAVVALTPFLTSTTGPGYSLQTAYSRAHLIAIQTAGGPISS